MTDPVTDPFADSRRAEETFRLEPAPDWVERCEIPWDSAAAPDDHVVAVLNHTQWAPERSVRHERSVRRLITREAVQSLSQVELNWDPAIETLIIHELGIWREGVKRDLTERSRFLLRQREGSFEQHLVHGRMSALVMIDDVRPGDSVELEFSVISQARLPGEKFDFVYATERTVTTGKWIVSLFVPDTTHFEWRGSSPSIEAVESRSELTGERVHTFSGKQESPAEIEGGIPIWFIPYEHFEVTGYHSWNEVAKCLALAWDTVPRDRDALRQFAEEVCREASCLEDKARALVDWVQEHIRYLGMVGGAGGLKPQSPNLVLERRYGDCKDKTLLLCSLLTEIGVTAEPLLVHTIRRQTVGTLLPAMGAFDHVIATFEIEGRRGFVDPTMAGDGGGLFDRCLPPYGMGLPVNAEATEPVTIPDLGPELNSLLVTEDFHLDHLRDLSYVDWRIEAVGGDANLLRARMRAVGGEAFAKAEAEDLRQVFPTARNAGPAKWVDDPTVNRVIIWGRAAFADWGTVSGRGERTFRYRPRWIYHALSAPSMAEKRRFDFQLVFPATIRHEIRIHKKKHGFNQEFRIKTENSYFRTSTQIHKVPDHIVEAIYAYHAIASTIQPDQTESYRSQLDQAASNQLGLTLVLPANAEINKSLPDGFEAMLPPVDSSAITLTRVDRSAIVNCENWIKKPSRDKVSFGNGPPQWVVTTAIAIAFVGIVNLTKTCTRNTGSRYRPTAVSPDSTRESTRSRAYQAWEEAFFEQRTPDIQKSLEFLQQIAQGEDRTTYATALTKLAEGNTWEAKQRLDRVPSTSRYTPKIEVVRGLIALAEGDLGAAEVIAEKAMTHYRNDPMTWALGSELARRNGAFNEALQLIREGLRLAPTNFTFRQSELFLLAQLPDQTEALRAAEKGELEFLSHSIFSEWLAEFHARNGKVDLGIEKARLAVARSKGTTRNRILLAKLLMESRRPVATEEARAIQSELLQLTNGDPEVAIVLSNTATAVGDRSFASEILLRAASISPTADLYAELALISIAQKNPSKAQEYLAKALQINPDSARVLSARSQIEGRNENESAGKPPAPPAE